VGERTRKERRRRKEEKLLAVLFLAGGSDRISAMRPLAASALGWNFGIWT